MTTDAVSPFDDDAPDLEGCTDARHCHRRRSARQEGAFTPEGRIRACHRPQGWGTSHPGTGGCKLHGGGTPNAKKSAERKIAENAVKTLGLPIDIGPADALLQEVQRTAGHVAWLGHLIAGMEANDLVWGMSSEIVEPDIVNEDNETLTTNVTGTYKAEESIWYQMYLKERRHLANVCKLALDAGVNERIIRMYEQAADTFVTLIENVLARLNLTPEQRREVPAAVVAELRNVTGDTA